MNEWAESMKMEKLAEIVKDMKVAMFTTQDGRGEFQTRPMLAAGLDVDGTLWFFASISGGLTQAIRRHPEVSLTFGDSSHHRFLWIKGHAKIYFDRAKAYDLWHPSFRTWFPQGIEDVDLTMIRVQVERAELWDSPTRTGVSIPGMISAVLSGERQALENYWAMDFGGRI